MIIARRSTDLTYSTDPTAHSLRSVMAPRAMSNPTADRAAADTRITLDLENLYPILFKAEPAPSRLVRRSRALAFRLSLVGTAAAILTILHR